jgi:hypothetical protein
MGGPLLTSHEGEERHPEHRYVNINFCVFSCFCSVSINVFPIGTLVQKKDKEGKNTEAQKGNVFPLWSQNKYR